MGPRFVYPAKAGYVHARSAAYLATHRRVGRRGVRILFYHRVSAERDALAVDPGLFASQMAYLVEHGFRVVDVAAAAAEARRPRPDPRVIGLSFDDGYQDVVDNALPVLERLGCSATVFIVPDAIDGRVGFSWYDRQPPLIGWDEIRRVDAGGVLRFEPHTLTHPNLLALDDDAAAAEISGSRRVVEERLGRTADVFAYPAGLFGDRERRLAEEAGYRFAVTVEPGTNDAATDPLALNRTAVERRDRMLDFRAKVAGGHDSPPPLRSLYRRLLYGRGGG